MELVVRGVSHDNGRIVSVLVTNALLLGAVAWLVRRCRPPRGTFTVVFGGVALLMTGLLAFSQVALVGAAVAGGVTADTLVARGRSARTVLTVTPIVLWGTWFAVYHTVWGLGWPVEFWTGSIVFTVLTGAGLSSLTSPVVEPPRPEAQEPPSRNGVAEAEPRTPQRTLAELLT